MTKHRKILNLIAAIRESHPDMVNIYTQGGCVNLFQILRVVYPEAKLSYDHNHLVVRIEKKLYDINGSVASRKYLPIGAMFKGKHLSRAISQMQKTNYNNNRFL